MSEIEHLFCVGECKRLKQAIQSSHAALSHSLLKKGETFDQIASASNNLSVNDGFIVCWTHPL